MYDYPGESLLLVQFHALGSAMKRLMIATVTVTLLLSALSFAQEKANRIKPDAPSSAAKTLLVYGRVSNDGRKLLTDLDSEWTVSNSEMLRGREGTLVRVRCYVDSDRSRIQILSIKKEQGESTYAAHNADSAFRR